MFLSDFMRDLFMQCCQTVKSTIHSRRSDPTIGSWVGVRKHSNSKEGEFFGIGYQARKTLL